MSDFRHQYPTTVLVVLVGERCCSEIQYEKRSHKRRSDDMEIVNKTLLELSGGDAWTPLLCGYAHKLKRPNLELCDNVVRNAMVGVY